MVAARAGARKKQLVRLVKLFALLVQSRISSQQMVCLSEILVHLAGGTKQNTIHFLERIQQLRNISDSGCEVFTFFVEILHQVVPQQKKKPGRSCLHFCEVCV